MCRFWKYVFQLSDSIVNYYCSATSEMTMSEYRNPPDGNPPKRFWVTQGSLLGSGYAWKWTRHHLEASAKLTASERMCTGRTCVPFQYKHRLLCWGMAKVAARVRKRRTMCWEPSPDQLTCLRSRYTVIPRSWCAPNSQKTTKTNVSAPDWFEVSRVLYNFYYSWWTSRMKIRGKSLQKTVTNVQNPIFLYVLKCPES